MREHIIINNDRTVSVPTSVTKIGNRFEHNVNKVTFDCPRYADDEQTIDLSSMKIYINYIRPDKKPLSSLAENVTIDEADPTIMHFDFNITRTVTLVDGVLDCLVCIKSTNSEGVEEHHWNSDIFSKLTVGKGMENEETIAEENIDLITQLLVNLDTTNAEVSDVSERIDGVENRVDSVEGDIDELKSNLANLNDCFEDEFVNIKLDFVSGLVVTDASIRESSNGSYATVEIKSEDVGKKFYITGSSFNTPFRVWTFKAIDGTVTFYENFESSAKQYTDVVFVANSIGTLYINRYTNHVGKMTYANIGRLNSDHLPTKVVQSSNVLVSGVCRTLDTTWVEGKILRTNGVIGDISDTSYKITDYIDISNFIKIKASSFMRGGFYYYAFYDENYTYISGLNSPDNGDTLYRVDVTIPISAKYIVLATKGNGALFASERYQKFDKYNGVKWVVIGDSISDHRNSTTTMRYYDYIADEYGFDLKIMGSGGTGYKKAEENGGAFYQRVSDVDTTADVCTVFGSINDLTLTLGTYTDTGTDTVCGCMNTFLDNFFSLCPTMPIGIISPIPGSGYIPSNESNKMALYTEELRKVAMCHSVPFLDLYHSANLRPWDEVNCNLCYDSSSLDGYGDGVHPNELGHKIISSKIREFLLSLI